jgi:hypothetical protein
MLVLQEVNGKRKLAANSNEAAGDVRAGNRTQIPCVVEEEKGL